MLSKDGFDLWADTYDETVSTSDENDEYPFTGYMDVLHKIYRTIVQKSAGQEPRPTVLDIGFGTGTLTQQLYARGFEVWGQDFSEKMCRLAEAKMPGAHLFNGDFSRELAAPILAHSYDFIVATYSLHHLTDSQKAAFLQTLRPLLTDGGMILIGDVAFRSRADLERCQKEAGEKWDDDEIYFVFEELQAVFPALAFEPASFCAGVLTLPR